MLRYVIPFALLLAACGQPADTARVEPADVVLRGGTVYTGDAGASVAQALAVSGQRIVYVGDNDGAAAYVGAETNVVELAGRFVMPGLVDAHLHPVRGALKELYGCAFPFTATPDEIAETIEGCVAARPDATWINGGQWDSSFFERFELESPREFLDAVSGDKAVYLSDDSGHNAWVNTKALELAGIDRATPDPAGGKIVRDADGVPNGVLIETAPKLVRPLIPPYSEAERIAAVERFSAIAGAFGITAAKAAATYEDEIAAMQAADQRGLLNVHLAVSIRTVYGHREEPLDYAAIEAIRDRYASTHVLTNFVKIFLDGVPTTARTAAMLAPYTPDDEHPDGFDGGPLHVGGALLAGDLTELDARGFTVKMHAAGDRSVRVALDAVEAARKANGDSGLRHELAHAGFIDESDIQRFATLNAVADLSPVIWHPSPIIDSVIAALGERGKDYWPVRDLIDAGAPLLAGSDWPSAVPDANPWTGIEALVTRRDPRGVSDGALWPEQAVTLAEAVRIYTMDGARALRLENDIGSLEAGKLADFIVLDRDLFATPVDDVADTRVLATWFEGRLVHGSL